MWFEKKKMLKPENPLKYFPITCSDFLFEFHGSSISMNSNFDFVFEFNRNSKEVSELERAIDVLTHLSTISFSLFRTIGN